jgi:hypothetical protein
MGGYQAGAWFYLSELKFMRKYLEKRLVAPCVLISALDANTTFSIKQKRVLT